MFECRRPSTAEGSVDDLPGALGIKNAALTVRFERGFNARFFLGRQRRRFVLTREAVRHELNRLDTDSPNGRERVGGHDAGFRGLSTRTQAVRSPAPQTGPNEAGEQVGYGLARPATTAGAPIVRSRTAHE